MATSSVLAVLALPLIAAFTAPSASGFLTVRTPRFHSQTQHASVPLFALRNMVMKLGADEKVVVIGVAADSGCGKSTFMRRLTNIFGGEKVGPLGGGFDNGGWETNTLVSDFTTVICLDDYHLNDRAGRKKTGLSALHPKENNFDLMYEQIKALKSGVAVQKPIYNHVNGTLDTPETIQPTPILIVEGLHPMFDSRVRELLDFSIYLDISDEIKFAWKIQRDMQERGHSLESIKASIEARKPDFSNYVAPQREFADIVLQVLPTELIKDEEGKLLRVRMIQRQDNKFFSPAYFLDKASAFSFVPDPSKVKPASPAPSIKISYGGDKWYNNEVSVLEMDGKLSDISSLQIIEQYLRDTGAKTEGELTAQLAAAASAPGTDNGTGVFQTLTSLKLREVYERITGKKISAKPDLVSA